MTCEVQPLRVKKKRKQHRKMKVLLFFFFNWTWTSLRLNTLAAEKYFFSRMMLIATMLYIPFPLLEMDPDSATIPVSIFFLFLSFNFPQVYKL